MIRVVVDTGVFVSALIGPRGGAPDRVVRAWADDRIEIVVSELLLAELERVLARPKFRDHVDAHVCAEYVARIRRHATLATDPADVPAVTRDPADDYLVALARATDAEAVVSGDRDLVDAGLSVPAVLTPRQLVERLGE